MNGFSELFGEFDILGGFWVNIELTFFSAVIAFVIGALLTVMRISPIASFRAAGQIYVSVVQSIPLTLVILGCSLGLWGQLGVELADNSSPDFIATNSFRLAVLGLSLYTAAFFSEALLSGFNTIPVGQVEAARAVGMNFGQTIRHVVAPQTLRGSIAPVGNTLVALAKNSTVAQAAGVFQAASVMSQMIEFRPDLMAFIFVIIAFGWTVIVLPVGLVFTELSKRLVIAR
ncbi:MAG: ABC transporter permease subunit [Ancrocorticia sp.]|jgi:glutamate transport system permease protein|nr:ABC transporter permease subunit [Ancrocorticia sp.]MCI2194409.1 ABC transporter permease subunit [Ancrocorticia sp.]MCI2199722.1 ABC transporter permease subunit [Ancrocorticia sp.]